MSRIAGPNFKQLWLSAIRKKPNQTCVHFLLHILLFIEAYLYKLNSPRFTETWHVLCTISQTNIYPLQNTSVFPMLSQSITCFQKRICKSVTHWCVGLCWQYGYSYFTQHTSADFATNYMLSLCIAKTVREFRMIVSGCILLPDQSGPTWHNDNIHHVTFMRQFATDSC